MVEEKPHDRFKRDGDDLIYTTKVNLVDALAGPSDPSLKTRTVQSLDKRTITFSIPYPLSGGTPIQPGQELRIKGEGMPKKGGAKGDLVVKIDVVFPPRLTPAQQQAIRSALSGAS